MCAQAAHRWCMLVVAMVMMLLPISPASAHVVTGSPSITAPTGFTGWQGVGVCLGRPNTARMCGLTCSADCAAPAAIIPIEFAGAVMGRSCPQPQAVLKAEDHRRAPDPHPPKPLAQG